MLCVQRAIQCHSTYLYTLQFYKHIHNMTCEQVAKGLC